MPDLPITVAARSLFSARQEIYSGNIAQAASDLAKAILAADEAARTHPAEAAKIDAIARRYAQMLRPEVVAREAVLLPFEVVRPSRELVPGTKEAVKAKQSIIKAEHAWERHDFNTAMNELRKAWRSSVAVMDKARSDPRMTEIAERLMSETMDLTDLMRQIPLFREMTLESALGNDETARKLVEAAEEQAQMAKDSLSKGPVKWMKSAEDPHGPLFSFERGHMDTAIELLEQASQMAIDPVLRHQAVTKQKTFESFRRKFLSRPKTAALGKEALTLVITKLFGTLRNQLEKDRTMVPPPPSWRVEKDMFTGKVSAKAVVGKPWLNRALETARAIDDGIKKLRPLNPTASVSFRMTLTSMLPVNLLHMLEEKEE